MAVELRFKKLNIVGISNVFWRKSYFCECNEGCADLGVVFMKNDDSLSKSNPTHDV